MMIRTQRIYFLLVIAAVYAALMVGTTPALSDTRPNPVVVELFTSQGCSSCPPAEAFLADLTDRGDVLPLEFHITYWDYIGWKDPFADERYTERQRWYNGHLGANYNYTPQMVIDGKNHEVGSRRSSVEAIIDSALMKRDMQDSAPAPNLEITGSKSSGLLVRLSGQPSVNGRYSVLLVGYDDRHRTNVSRGENTGRHLVNAHVVRGLEPIAQGWQGGALSVTVPPGALKGDKGSAVLVQDLSSGQIAVAGMISY